MVETYLSPSWIPLLNILSKDPSDTSLTSSENWLADATGSAFGTKPTWAELLSDLSHKCPTLDGDILTFRPLIFLIPTNPRHQLLMLVYRHREEIPLLLLEDFINSIENESALLSDWNRMVINLLNFHCSVSSNQSSSVHNVNIDINLPERHACPRNGVLSTTVTNRHGHSCCLFSTANAVQSVELCDQLKADLQPNNVNVANVAMAWSMPCHGVFDATFESSQLKDFPSSLTSQCNANSTPSSELSRSQLRVTEEKTMEVECSEVFDDSSHQLNHASLMEPATLLILESVKEQWLLGQATSDLNVLNNLSSVQLLSIGETMGLSAMPDVAINAACQSFVLASRMLSLGCGTVLARQCLLPRLVHLEQPASRLLTTAVATFSTTFTRHAVEDVMLPIVRNVECNSFTAELLIKLVRDVFIPEKKLDTLSCLLTEHTIWSEHVLAVLQLILDSKIEFSNGALHQLVCSLNLNSTQNVHSTSPKFAKMILSVVNIYGQRLSATDLQQLKAAADDLHSFMKKPVLVALQKLLT